ncbi:hypothetical protein BOX15_Mlig004094g4, partial [Macrostomum lignano]
PPAMSTEYMSNRSLGEQLQAFYNCILLSAEEAAQRQLAIDRLTELVSETLPKATVHLVGSSASGIASKNSSVDLSIEIPDDDPTGANAPTAAEAAPQADAASRDRERADQIFGLLQRREGEFIRVQVMHSRQVSVVTCVYRQADLRCSVRLGRGGQQHRRAAALLNGLASLSEAFRLLTVVTREWALSRQLIRRKGALTGYAVALLVLFHMEQGGLVPPSVVRALARGHRKSEVSEALRKWQPEPLSTEQLGEQFCGLVRLYATIGFFASSAVCVLTGRLLDRGGREDPFPGARVSLPCPVSGENAGRTYSRVSEPEEPFYRTALNLAKDHDLFTACFARNLDGMRKAKLVQQLPAFKRLEEQQLVPPMQRLVERVQRTLENRGRSGYEKFAGRLVATSANGADAAAPSKSSPPQRQQHQFQNPHHQQYRQRPQVPRFRASSSPKFPTAPGPQQQQQPMSMLRQIPRPPRPLLRLPRSCSGNGGSGRGRSAASKSAERPASAQTKAPKAKRDNNSKKSMKKAKSASKKPQAAAKKPEASDESAAKKPEASGESAAKKPEASGESAAKKPEASDESAAKKPEALGESAAKKPEALGESAAKKPEANSGESVVKKPEAAELENSASEARAISNRATFAAVAANKLADPTKSASASGNLLDRRPLTVNNRAADAPPLPASSKSLPTPQQQQQRQAGAPSGRSYAGAVTGQGR